MVHCYIHLPWPLHLHQLVYWYNYHGKHKAIYSQIWPANTFKGSWGICEAKQNWVCFAGIQRVHLFMFDKNETTLN